MHLYDHWGDQRYMFLFFLFFRENDQSPIALDSDLVERILYISTGLPYHDLRDPTMGEFYDLDPEVSTPDHTTNSDGEIPTSSHLAEQEGAFSEDNFTIATPDSMPSSPQNAPELTSTPDLPQVTIELQSSPYRQPSEVDVEVEEAAGAVVYSESEADNSCVLDVNGEDEDDDDSSTNSLQDHTSSTAIP